MAGKRGQSFGGDWTEEKLDMLQRYLSAYTTVLKKQPFRLAYIDAFAGSGYRQLRAPVGGQAPLLFEELASDEAQHFLDGSARIALQTEPPFDAYVFVDSKRANVAGLERLKEDFPERAASIRIHSGDSNARLREWCRRNIWREWRAVVFLDPFGMQVEWATLEAIASTRAIDLWTLFPLGVAVNRLLMRDPSHIPPGWRDRLDRVFGSDDWFDAFYEQGATEGLFGDERETRKACTFEDISEYYLGKLRGIFPKVADNPRVLYNSSGNPIFEVCFAAANPGRGGDIALRIAQCILEG